MNTSKFGRGLSILAGGLLFVGAASAVDLITNGSFEGPGGGDWNYYATYNSSELNRAASKKQIPISNSQGEAFVGANVQV